MPDRPGCPSGKVPRRSRGSVMIVVGVILFVLLLFSGGFIQYMLSTSRQTHRQTEQRFTGMVAQALATLAVHKIQLGIVRDQTSDLYQYLVKPMAAGAALGDLALADLDLKSGTPNFATVVDALMAPLASFGQVTYKVQIGALGADFKPCGLNKYYPREKRGLVRITVTTTFRKVNDSKPPVVEDFNFLCRVKVTAALMPVLSKFTMYVENAFDGDSNRLNAVSTSVNGNHTGGSRPWLFDHGDKTHLPRLVDLVKSPRGLVFLGGGKVHLNLARGWKQPGGGSGEYSEELLMYQGLSGDGDGLFVDKWLPSDAQKDWGYTGWEQGMTDDVSATTPGAAEWWDFVRQDPDIESKKKARHNSVLKLFGTGTTLSPTLVLGQVYRATICARAYKCLLLDASTNQPQFSPNFLPYLSNPAEYAVAAGTTYPTDDTPWIGCFLNTAGVQPAGISDYQKKWASGVAYMPWNSSMGFMFTNNRDAAPWHHFGSDPLLQYVKNDPADPDVNLVTTIPDPFKVVDGTTSLSSMQPLIEGSGLLQGGVAGDRAIWVIDVAKEADIMKALADRGMLKNGKLDLNGWVVIRGNGQIKVDANFELASNGGLYLEKGNITVSRAIDGAGKYVLQLVAADGDVIVDFSGQVDAALVAKGTVKMQNAKAVVNGAVAMGKFDLTSCQQEVKIVYNGKLAALPNSANDNDSEKDLLGVAFEPQPILVQ